MASISEQIIEQVKLYPILYDLSHPEYKNIRKKNEIWDELGRILNAEGDDLKKKWKNLRDAYAKHIRSEQTRTGQKANTTDRYKMWPWAQQMSFFKAFLQFAHTESNIQSTEDINTQQTKTRTPDLTTDLAESPPIIPNQETQSVRATPTATNVAKRRRVATSQSLQQPNSVSKVLGYLENRVSNNETKDDIDLLFMGYAKTVKKFSPRRQTLIKLKIAKLLMEEEIQQQTEDAATISRPPSQLTGSSLSTTSIQSPVLSPESYASQETITDSTTKWYEGFSEHLL